jgi:hypothetical protein
MIAGALRKTPGKDAAAALCAVTALAALMIVLIWF